MTSKINFTSKTALISALFSFCEMSELQDMLSLAAMEATESNDSGRLETIKSAASKLGIEIEFEVEPKPEIVNINGNESSEGKPSGDAPSLLDG